MNNTLIRKARLIDPSQRLDQIGSLLISDGKIAWFGRGKAQPPFSYTKVVEAAGLIACAGFVDLHCHLREPGFENKETIATGTAAAAKGGFTTVCCMPNTSPPIDNRSAVYFIHDKATTKGTIRVLPIGCITRGRRGEEVSAMDELVQAGVVAFSDDGSSVMNSGVLRRAMQQSLAFNLPIIEHCEDKALVEGGQINEGLIATQLGLIGMPAVAEEIIIARDIALSELTGARLHIAHASTAGAVELIAAAKRRGLRVTAEVTPHHLTLTEELLNGYNANAKVNPPLRTEKDIRALIQGLKDNVIDAIATDHAPHTQAEKSSGFNTAPFGISNIETALGSLLNLVHGGHLDLNLLISKLTSGPAAIIGEKFGKLGTLEIGTSADIVLFHPDMEWIVDPRDFISKGKNTPLAGTKMQGKVVATFYQGRLVYSDISLRLKHNHID